LGNDAGDDFGKFTQENKELMSGFLGDELGKCVGDEFGKRVSPGFSWLLQ